MTMIHVATINNATINSSNLLTLIPSSTPNPCRQARIQPRLQLQRPVPRHRRLHFSRSDSSAVQCHPNQPIGPPPGVQFGTYAAALSFFGLTQLPSVSENFMA